MPRRLWLLPLLFVLHAFPFLSRPAVIGGDEPHYLLFAHSVAVDRDFALDDDYDAVARGSAAAGDRFRGKALDRHLLERDGRRVFSHPIGLPLLLSPFIALQQAIAPGSPPDIPAGLLVLAITFAALLAGIDLLAMRAGREAAWVAGLAVYFSTPLWYYSRTLFAEPLLWAFTVIACWSIARKRFVAASIALAFVFAVKEIGALLVVAILLHALLRNGVRRATALAIGPAAAFAAWAARNLVVYGNPLVTAQPWQWGDPLGGAAGLLFDWRNGLFVFAPVAIAALLAIRRMRFDSTAVTCAATAAVWFAIAASWTDWRGGSSFGPRLIVPLLPLLSIPIADSWSSSSPGFRRVTLALATAGFALHAAAAAEPFRAFWNSSPSEILARQPVAAIAALAVGTAAALRTTRTGLSTSR